MVRGSISCHHLISILLLTLIFSSLFIADASAQNRKKRKKQLATVVSTAKTYMGTPYQYGGTSRGGIDCSALIYNSYRAAGVSIPRTAKEQSKSGRKRGWSGLREGDVVFFKFKQKRDKWWHSGMITYVDKNTIRFIHASSSRGVVESDLMSDYYRENVKRFRRYIK